jgi:pilus assembly protein Flp/PilA
MLLRSLNFRCFRRMLLDEGGATAVEYAMIAAGVAVAIVATVTAMGSSLKGMYQTVNGAYPN